MLPFCYLDERHPQGIQKTDSHKLQWPRADLSSEEMHQLTSVRKSFQPLADPEAWQSKSHSLAKSSPLTLPTSCTLRKQREPFKSLPKASKILLWMSCFSPRVLAPIKTLDLYEEADADTITPSRISLNGKPIMTPVLFLMVSDAPHQRGNRCLARV